MFKRLWTLIKGFLGLFVSGLEKNNPEALLESEKENLRREITKFNEGLAAHAAMVEGLMTQAKTLKAQETELKAKTTALLKAGQKDAAAQMALRYQRVDKQEDEVRAKLEDAEVRYKELVRARDVIVTQAKQKIENLAAGINEAKIENAMADMSEMAASMTAQIGTSADTLNRLEEMVEGERAKAAGRARVARDSVDLSEIALKEGEQAALAEMALADFAAEAGIVLEPSVKASESAPAESVGGIMGPAVTA